ncbi:MAG: Pr6Pr family membrane protein, partial [Ginsengibacter sp.]
MKKKLALLFALIGWFAVIAQYVLMIENRVTSVAETTIRFFSFFTILTNLLVALYFTLLFFTKNENSKLIDKPGTLTAVTIYITMVGLVYQVALRHIWQPKGMQLIVNELLHSVIPVLVIIFWYLYETTRPIKYGQIPKWAIYP